jgi:hypothetical protein
MAKQKAPEGETKEERFIRIAGLRTSNVVDALELLGQMGADVPSAEFTVQAFSAIRIAVDKAERAWKDRDTAAKRRAFTFSSNQAELPHTSKQPPTKK